ncbi:hypothetical protein CF68_22540 [Cupriavidus sp. SK-4]|nr:hypothetical protein CF68_22540 [Cupriavidus sp. SK-4]
MDRYFPRLQHSTRILSIEILRGFSKIEQFLNGWKNIIESILLEGVVMFAANNPDIERPAFSWPIIRFWLLEEHTIDKCVKSVNTTIIATIHPTKLNFLLSGVKAFEDLLKGKILKRLISR